MTVSENIRELARKGMSVAEVARQLGIRYQHAYNVLKADGLLRTLPDIESPTPDKLPVSTMLAKPPLSVDTLTAGGFVRSSRWVMSPSGVLLLEQPLPKAVGVYAFARIDVVLYVGVATMGLAKRLYFYAKPGATQRTSLRLNGIIKSELLTTAAIDIYIAFPPDQEWNGLPIHGSAGLELGLIKKYSLPWNMRSAG